MNHQFIIEKGEKDKILDEIECLVKRFRSVCHGEPLQGKEREEYLSACESSVHSEYTRRQLRETMQDKEYVIADKALYVGCLQLLKEDLNKMNI